MNTILSHTIKDKGITFNSLNYIKVHTIQYISNWDFCSERIRMTPAVHLLIIIKSVNQSSLNQMYHNQKIMNAYHMSFELAWPKLVLQKYKMS